MLFLNLTYWNSRKALASGPAPTAAALFLGESVASAFDLYVVGQLLRQGTKNAYLSSQVPALSAAALDSGVTEAALADAGPAALDDPAMAMDRAVRAAPEALAWLESNWLG